MPHERWDIRRVTLLMLSAILGTCAVPSTVSQAQETVSSQVEIGRNVYVRECARCHGPIGGPGQTAPALVSREIAQKLTTFQTSGALFTFLRFAMPQDKPGSLSEEDYWAVQAFVLMNNRLLYNDVSLGPETADSPLLRR